MIRFILNNTEIQTTAKTGITLLDFIREHQNLKGTKIGCREGDCGACTVLVGTLVNQKIRYRSVTSCISPLGNAHGKHIVTVEGVNLDKILNTSQQALSDNYATQCGFCTPGFVVSMTGHVLSNTKNTSCSDAISGNICRCTGYKSIERASDDLEHKLQNLTSNSLDDLITHHFIPSYFKDIPQKLAKLNSSNQISKSGTLVAGGTDIYVRHANTLALEDVQLINNENTLKGISLKNNLFTIGASTTVSELLEQPDLNQNFPKLKSFLKLVSSEQIRNMGTLGGNFVNASPIGDMSVFFLALNSTLSITSPQGKRHILFQDFHQDYKIYDLKHDEMIATITFEKFDTNTQFNFEKVSKRTHLDIATVNSACRITTDDKHKITALSISIGGVAAIPKLLQKTNAFLIGKTISNKTIQEAESILQSEIKPISDIRGDEQYKRLLARQLFFAHFITLFPKVIDFKALIR